MINSGQITEWREVAMDTEVSDSDRIGIGSTLDRY
jgi:hypothetical protein